MSSSQSSAAPFLSCVHFGDLHIQRAKDENYQDCLGLIQEANNPLAGEVDCQTGAYAPLEKSKVDYENVIGAYQAKGIFGTQLDPNENGTKDPWPSWCGRS